MRFDTLLLLVKHRTNGEIALERLESGFYLDELQLELPQLSRIGFSEIGAQ